MSGLNSKIYPTVWLFEGFEYPVLNFIEIGSGDQSQGMPETLINELKEGEQFRYKGLLVDSERQVSFLQLERVPAQKTIDCPLDAVRSYSQMSLKEDEGKRMLPSLDERTEKIDIEYCFKDFVRWERSDRALAKKKEGKMTTNLDELARIYRKENDSYHDTDGVDVEDVFRDGYTRAITDVVGWLRSHQMLERTLDDHYADEIENKFLRGEK